jgi:kallikrein
MRVFFILLSASLVLAQKDVDDAINSIFLSNNSLDTFLSDYEEITPPPLKSIGALEKCGEGEQRNRFVCVPYYNCNADTHTVEENPDLDGSRRIDIRIKENEERKCDHYMEVCCEVSNSQTGGDNSNSGRMTTKPTAVPTKPTAVPTKPTKPSRPTNNSQTGGNNASGQRVNCGIRNSQGIDFNLIGGTNEANFGEFPWIVAILRKNPAPGENLAICGGSLIGPRVVLTGAHCVANVDISTIKIRAGEWDTQTENERIPYQERNIKQKIIHNHFMKGNLYNDIALLILDRNLAKTESVGTICLPEQDEHFDARDCFATGWGKNVFGQQGQYAVIPKKIQMPLVHTNACQQALRKTRLGNSFILHRSFICAGGEPDLDTCTGDGGSPLVCPDRKNPNRYLQVGIVAWGIGCGENQVPGVYADVATFRNWVDEKLQELGIGTSSYLM